jgi:hypothetical protein
MRNRSDTNRDAIIEALESVGASVDPLPGGNGRPDLAVGIFSRNYFLEIKRDEKQELNTRQKIWHQKWKGQKAIVCTVEQAYKACEIAINNNLSS